jgi:hypothetical protein
MRRIRFSLDDNNNSPVIVKKSEAEKVRKLKTEDWNRAVINKFMKKNVFLPEDQPSPFTMQLRIDAKQQGPKAGDRRARPQSDDDCNYDNKNQQSVAASSSNTTSKPANKNQQSVAASGKKTTSKPANKNQQSVAASSSNNTFFSKKNTVSGTGTPQNPFVLSED